MFNTMSEVEDKQLITMRVKIDVFSLTWDCVLSHIKSFLHIAPLSHYYLKQARELAPRSWKWNSLLCPSLAAALCENRHCTISGQLGRVDTTEGSTANHPWEYTLERSGPAPHMPYGDTGSRVKYYSHIPYAPHCLSSSATLGRVVTTSAWAT